MDKNKVFDVSDKARSILYRHTHGFMSSTEYHPESNEELLDTMLSECGAILTDELLNGKLTPMQYNDVRNCLAEMLWDTFKPSIEEEEKAAHQKFPEELRK